MKYIFSMAVLCIFAAFANAQTLEVRGTVIDKLTGEPVSGASLHTKTASVGRTDASGAFKISLAKADSIFIRCAGFKVCCFFPAGSMEQIALEQDIQNLQAIVVTGGRTAEKRRESPVSISTINTQTLKENKPTSIDQVLNKANGVFMVNLGNEQHQMSIRQPMTTKSLFLYLEDGIPVRTTGLYNHNALLEMNMAAIKQIEVLRGPASAMYGAEAIGGAVNVMTLAPPATSMGQLNVQANTNGYKRTDIQYGNTLGKTGFLFSGYYANNTDGRLQHSDFDKYSLTLKTTHQLNGQANWINSVSYNDYKSDMFGALDSTHFAARNFSSLNNFTYRKVKALRAKSQLNYQWNPFSETMFAAVYRNNTIQQNPSYRIKNDYRRLPNGGFAGDPLRAHGEINNSHFNTYALFVQHDQKLEKISSKITTGLTVDLSPSDYTSNYIRIDKNSEGYFTDYSKTDSALSNYSTGITNLASYINYSADVAAGLKLVAALRYDFYHYNYSNALSGAAFSGAPSTKEIFHRITPKLGFTYNYKDIGFYANYSQGFVPPQISELFQGTKVPYLSPQTFSNYEVGGWMELFNKKVYADWSLYNMLGTNEIISVLAEDGSSQNRNSGETKHVGIEYGINFKPSSEWKFRLGASNAEHSFINYVEKGIAYNGNIMAGAPKFLANAEAAYKPAFIKGLRTSVEWQHQGSYWMDNANSKMYDGFDVFNVRAGYQLRQFEIWLNVLNVNDRYYSVSVTKSGSNYSYNLGQPRTFNTGVAYHLNRRNN